MTNQSNQSPISRTTARLLVLEQFKAVGIPVTKAEIEQATDKLLEQMRSLGDDKH